MRVWPDHSPSGCQNSQFSTRTICMPATDACRWKYSPIISTTDSHGYNQQKKLHPDSQGVITNYITETEKKNVQIHEVWLVVVASIQSSLIYIIIDTKSSGRNSSVRSDWRIKQIKIARDERHTQERRRRKTKKKNRKHIGISLKFMQIDINMGISRTSVCARARVFAQNPITFKHVKCFLPLLVRLLV